MLCSDKHCTKAKRKAEAYSEPHGLMCSKHKMNVDSPIRLPLVVADFMDKFSKLRTHLMSLHCIREYVFHPMMGGDVMKEEWNKRIQNLIKDFSSFIIRYTSDFPAAKFNDFEEGSAEME